ncbi:hypothetical protein Pst134EA_000914 [Puccinia striiformis f. sp. tritici]|uniref:hypothetical protein n=1 Tax=Puccinia striiformis f. sp. tritici TaxID=168172 RepID=UPI00200732C5|nr:hypothetical protein Pst134EA_000914 [Puccinia striiformis f. sp. tritici]KAH9473852.1 hypothetical protein Pst134EA_000914 [Puccinia striiformis f. sp. tritici]
MARWTKGIFSSRRLLTTVEVTYAGVVLRANYKKKLRTKSHRQNRLVARKKSSPAVALHQTSKRWSRQHHFLKPSSEHRLDTTT